MSEKEYATPLFSVNTYDKDGDVVDTGIYLHYGDTIIKVADTITGFKKHASVLAGMTYEIEKNCSRYIS